MKAILALTVLLLLPVSAASQESARPQAGQHRSVADGPIGCSVARLAGLVTANPTWLESVNSGAALQPTTSGRRRRGALFWTAVGAGAGVAGAFISNAANPACDEPDNMCSANVVVFGGLGALIGLLFGFGR